MLRASVRRRVSVVSFCAGLQLGAVMTAAVLLVTGSILWGVIPLSLGVRGLAFWPIAAVLVLHQLDILKLRMPMNGRLVPSTVFRLGPVFGPLQFGIEMGTGARTFVSSSSPYVLVAAVFLWSEPAQAFAVAHGFAVGRAAMTVASVTSADSTRWHRRFNGFRWIGIYMMLLTLLSIAVASRV